VWMAKYTVICDNGVIQRADNTVRVDEVIYRADNLCGWSNIGGDSYKEGSMNMVIRRIMQHFTVPFYSAPWTYLKMESGIFAYML
jgi:hypothetical protein